MYWLLSTKHVPTTARWASSAAAAYRTLRLALAAPLPPRGSQISPIPHVKPPTHPRGHSPSWSADPVAHLVSALLLPRLYRCDTMPSSSPSSFRTSLLVYPLLPLSPNIWSVCLKNTRFPVSILFDKL